jgi:hypothetical protein
MILPSSYDVTDLITPNNKKRHHEVKKRFISECDQFESIVTGFHGDETTPLSEELVRLCPQLIGFDGHDERLLVDVGLDSLTAVMLIQVLKDSSNAYLSLKDLYFMSVQQLNALFSAKLSKGILMPKKSVLEWRKEKDELLDLTLSIPLKIKSAQPSESITILMTGATGFLGPVLVCDILRNLIRRKHEGNLNHFRIVCLVRGSNPKHRLIEEIRQSQTLTAQAYPNESSSLISSVEEYLQNDQFFQVLQADITLPLFGLQSSDYDDLLASVSHVVHNAAQVSHLLPYNALKNANVMGTLRMIHFCRACSLSVKVVHMSSIAALPAGQVTSSFASLADHWTDKVLDEKNGESLPRR